MRGKFCEKVSDFIARHHLIGRYGPTGKNERVIVGLSGGADSVALLLVLRRLGYECVAAHCNFHLRGEESMRDERFCRALCERTGVEFVMTDFNVDARRRETGESVEMACRSLRYEWWDRLMATGKGSVIAVGHHKEDNIETFFLNMLRGSGLAGLKGMMPRTMNIIRPMLDCDKAEILDFLNEEGETYITDSSNLSNDFKRNRLRNVVLPEFEKSFPGMMEAVSDSIAHLRDNYSLYTDYCDKLRGKYVGADGAIDLSLLVTSEKNARMVLYELLSKVGMNMSQVENILAAINENGSCSVSGKLFKTGTVDYLLNRGKLVPVDSSDMQNTETVVNLTEEPFSLREMTTEEFFRLASEKNLHKDAIYLDESALEGNARFVVRPWRKGDRIRPYGMKGSRLVSDLLSDAKYSVAEKRDVRILTRDGEILWVIGLRASGLFAVTERSAAVYEIRYMNDKNMIKR